MKDLKQRIEDLYFAIRMTSIAFRNCDTPLFKDMHLAAMEYYSLEISIAESQLLVYTDTKHGDQQ